MPPSQGSSERELARSEEETGISDLPDDVLTAVLQHLTQAERLQHAAMVCKRFCKLSCSPKLVHHTVVSVRGGTGGSNAVVAKARGLLGWLAKFGQHVSRLDILMTPMQHGSAAEREEMAASAAACLAACGGPAGRLEHLWVDSRTPLATTAWLLTMPRLKFASIGSELAGLTLPTDALHSLTNLVSLALRGRPLRLPAELPPNLTRLELTDRSSVLNWRMPQEIVHLSRLCALVLARCTYSKDSMRALTALAPTLTSLSVDACMQLPWPTTLSTLTGLHRLEVFDTPAAGQLYLADADELDASLQQLRQLTALALLNAGTSNLPSAVGSLPRLARLAFTSDILAVPTQLPAGAWLHSLQALYIQTGMLAKSVAVLAQAPQLEAVCLVGMPLEGEGVTTCEWNAFFEWAAVHKPLRRFIIKPRVASVGFEWSLFDDIMRLRSARPALEVYRLGSPEHPDCLLDDF